MTNELIDLENMKDILRESGAHLESGGSIIFYVNTAKTGILHDLLNLYELLKIKNAIKKEATM